MHFQKIGNNKKNSVKMGLEIISYRAPQFWNLVLTKIKNTPYLSIFKEKTKSWYLAIVHAGYSKHTLQM